MVTDEPIGGKWIWCRGEEKPKNFYLHIRRSFNLGTEVTRAKITLTADSRYQLHINGIRAAQGPARSDRRWQCVDRYDVSAHLHPGRNVVAVLVHHYGEWTFSYMLGRGGFLADLMIECQDGSSVRVRTDESWLVRPAEAWERRLPRMSIQLDYPEVYDARKEFEGWTGAAFDDSSWEHATVIGPPGMEPWPGFMPRQIPPMRETPISPVDVIDHGWVGAATTGYYVDLLSVVWSTTNAVAYLATFVLAPEEMNVEIHAGSQEAIKLWLNRELVINHFVTRDAAPDQEIVPAHLKAGWNVVLAKIVQGEGQWHFYFRLTGPGSERCRFSRYPEAFSQDQVDPWWILAPLESLDLRQGFDTVFPPEIGLDLAAKVKGKDGAMTGWISAGVTREAQLTSVIMSREKRLVAPADCIRHLDGLIRPGEMAEFHPGSALGSYAVIDFGKEVAGYPMLEIDGAIGGEIIDIGYSEVLSTPDGEILSPASRRIGIVNADRAGVHYADRYICRPGKQSFRTFEKRAFRYLQVDVRNTGHPIKVGPISLMLSTYPVVYRGNFECSDDVLNRIWQVGLWTVQLNMEDAYTDCPWRERGQWWGDVRIQALVNYYAFGDLALIRNGLTHIAQSQDDEGWTRGVYPTDWSNAILPTFTMLWIISLWDYYLFSGDDVLLKDLFRSVDRVLTLLQRYRGDHNLLKNLPHWLFVDWAGVDTRGESTAINALYCGALRAGVEIARVAGRQDVSKRYNATLRKTKAGMMAYLWDTEKKCFRDCLSQQKSKAPISEQSNCWAAVFDVIDKEQGSRMIRRISQTDKVDVCIGTPYFAYYLLETLARAGEHQKMLGYIRERWKPMLDWGATTWWEQWEPKASFCHGWSAGPTYFLQAEILGAKPAQPGWKEILIEPHIADLSWARGKIPTPSGTIALEWKTTDGLELTIDVPAKTHLRLPLSRNARIVATLGKDGRRFTPARVPDDHRHISYVIRKPGVYTFRSRRRPRP